MTTTTDPATTTASPEPARTLGWGKLAGVVAGLAAAVALMLCAFLTPAINSGPKDLPLAVSGPTAAVSQLTGALAQRSPDAFDVTTYATPAEARAAITDREAIGGITVGADGVTIITAAGAGTPYVNLLKGIGAGLTTAGQHVSYAEVAPLTTDDPAGAGLTALGLPLAFGGMASAVLLSNLVKGSRSRRAIAALAFSAAAGLVVAAILIDGFGSIDANYWALSGGLALGIAAISVFVLGMESRFGYAGLGIGALLMMFVSNPLSGLATGPHWLPAPWGTIGQFLPIGAAGTVLRSIAFFAGAGMTRALVVLVCWILAGLALMGAKALHDRRATA